MQDVLTNNSGYERAKSLFDTSGRDVRKMFEVTAYRETDWLEVKCTCFRPKDYKCEPGKAEETEDAFLWFCLIEPLIALANFHGGVLLIGVKEDRTAISAENVFQPARDLLKGANGQAIVQGNFETLQNTVQRILDDREEFETNGEQVGQKEKIKYHLGHPLSKTEGFKFDLHKMNFDGCPVLAIFVCSYGPGLEVLRTTTTEIFQHISGKKDTKGESLKNRETCREKFYPVRRAGEVGEDLRKEWGNAELNEYRQKNPGSAYAQRKTIEYANHIPVPRWSQDRRTSLFVGRLDELRQLHKELFTERRPVLIYGEAGSGKTSLAFQYAWTHCCEGLASSDADYAVALYVRAEGAKDLADALCRLPEQDVDAKVHFSLPGADDGPQIGDSRMRAQTILIRLKKYGKVLILLDNIDEPNILSLEYGGFNSPHLGLFDSVFLYATCRSNCFDASAGGTFPLEVGRLPTADGLSLLRNHRSFEDGTDEAAAAELIVQMTEGHAWSLDIIGAELKGRRYKTDRDFRDKCTELEALGCQQVIDSKTNSRYSRIAHGEVETSALLEPTFKLMVEHFGGEFLEIFKILGWFPVDEVSESILRQMVEEMLGSSLSASAWKNDFWMPLLDFSIVHESSPGFGCFHRLTHAVICKRFQRDEVWPYVFKVLKQVSVRMFKASEDKNDSLKGLNENLEIMFKILTCAHVGHEVEIADWEVERGGCLEAFREYLYVPRGIQDRVLDYAKGILKTLEKRQVGNVVNGKSLALARVHCYLSTVNYILGQYDKACQSAEDALRSFPRKDGDEVGDNDLIQCYEAAAEAYNSVGWRNQDVSFKRKGLYYATMASRLFPQNQHESTDYATCLSLVSVCHDAIGERDQALQMGREALAIRQKVLPPDSLELARSYNNLANTYVHFGEDVSCTEEERRRYFNLAIEHAEKALKLRINVTKENHPGVAWNLSCLSAAYLASGEFEERFGHSTESLSAFQKAFEYCRQALDMRVAIFSVMHPAVAKSCGRLVQICQHLPADDLHVKSERQRCAHYHHQIFDGYEKEIGRAKESGNDVRYEALKAELKRSQTYFPPI